MGEGIMHIPDWADEQLSKDLKVLRAKGENQDLEYMESFPQNVRELAKEIAAFATSNQGIILIGVSNEGDLIGIDNASTSEGRDNILRRTEGICRGTIKPSITPVAKFVIEDKKIVFIIIVPKGSQPIYYCNNIPYVRHITESRPAEPHEIIEFIRKHLSDESPKIKEHNESSDLMSQLARILIEILIYGEEVKERFINPWLEMWRAQFQLAASDLRELAIQDIAIQNNLSDELDNLSLALDKVVNFRLHLGCGPELSGLIKQVIDITQHIKKEKIDVIQLSQASLSEVKKTLTYSSRKLKNLSDRAEEMIEEGRLEEFQKDVANIGHTILKIGYYNIDSLQDGLGEKLRYLGKNLHLIETKRIYMDGGRSIRTIVEEVKKLNQDLEGIIKS
jgi:hypothetical protein